MASETHSNKLWLLTPQSNPDEVMFEYDDTEPRLLGGKPTDEASLEKFVVRNTFI